MAEFIQVTEFDVNRQVLINTDEIQRVSQTVDDEGVVRTYLTYRGYSTRIRETLAQVTALLAAPVGRHFSFNTFMPAQPNGYAYGMGVIGG